MRAVAALLALVAGYYLVADLRGFGVGVASVAFWVVAAAVVGPVLGAGAVWSGRACGAHRVLGALVLPVLLGAEAAYGLVVVGGSTSAAYWVGEGVFALLLAGVLLRPRRDPDRRTTGGRGLDSMSVR